MTKPSVSTNLERSKALIITKKSGLKLEVVVQEGKRIGKLVRYNYITNHNENGR